MKKILSIIISASMLFAAGCEKEYHEDTVPQTPCSKTVIAYFFGTSLSYYFNINIESMQKAVSAGALGDGGRLVMYYQKNSSTVELREIRYDAKSRTAVTEILDTFSPEGPLTAQSFGENVKRLAEYAPAESYSMILLGHSTAWLPKNPVKETASTYSAAPRFVPSFEKMPGAAVTRTIGETSNELDIDELAEGLASTGIQFDCLYFDVCFMSSLEAAYELRSTADIIIGSPCEIMGIGSPYDRILAPLFDNDCKGVCDAYVDFFKSYSYPSGCIAAIDCSKLGDVAEAAKRINAAPADADFDASKIQTYEGRKSSGHWFYDAGDYYTSICADKELAAEFDARLGECIVYCGHTDAFYSAYNARFNTINRFSGINVTPDEKCIEAMTDGIHRQTLEYYNLSLRRTAWYRDTH